MSSNMFNDHWYRVHQLKPELKPHVSLTKHSYAGTPTWVLVDSLSGTQHRLGRAAYYLVARMDGKRTVQALWDAAMLELDALAPTQGDFIDLLGRLHQADLLQTDITPNVAAVFKRTRKKRVQRKKQKLLNPLYLKFSLFDPDSLLQRLAPLGRLLFSPYVVALWLASIVWGLLMVNTHWDQLKLSVDHTFTSPTNLVMLVIAFIGMKFLHELAHGLAVKRWGGEVHSIGFVLLVLLPIPFVDASAANAFADKYKRVTTSAAGIMTELFLAVLGLTVWVAVEPGLVRQFAANVMLIGAVSSLFFNGNPLLRFDGYYVLSDLIEIPNLASRSQTYLGQIIRRLLIGPQQELSTAASRREAIWLAGYGLLSFLYRIALIFVIALYLSEVYLVLGVMLGVWALLTQIVWPVLKGARSLARLSQSALQNTRMYVTTGLVCMAVYVSLFVIAMPNTTYADGIVWLPDDAVVRTSTECSVAEILVEPGAEVTPGTPLITCENDELRTQADVLRAQIQALQTEYRSYGLREQVKRKMLADEIASLTAELDLVRERIDSLRVYSRAIGHFVPATTRQIDGRFFEQGESIGYILHPDTLKIKAALRQQDVDFVAFHRSIEVRFPGREHKPVVARIGREMPAPSDVLPNASLGTMGGGRLAVDRNDPKGLLLKEPVYLVDLDLLEAHIPSLVGLRAHVLFEQIPTPMAVQWAHGLRQMLMRRLDV